jgi:ABC-type nitrate/sulfonate/bicarbonate transport system ATPase subunit
MFSYEEKETLLSIQGISKAYDAPVLNNISFEVKDLVRPGIKQGQIVSLIGRSGCGKSTLFRIMAGLEQPDKGCVLVNNKPVNVGDVGVVFQDSYIFPWRRIKDILKKGIMDAGDLAVQMDIEKLLPKYSSQISGGQKQRVAIAEQILLGKKLLLLDEPFSGLDSITIDKTTRILVELSLMDEDRTIVIVSHDLSNALAISDSAIVMGKADEGSVVLEHVNLAALGLAWQPDIKRNQNFQDLLEHVKSIL